MLDFLISKYIPTAVETPWPGRGQRRPEMKQLQFLRDTPACPHRRDRRFMRHPGSSPPQEHVSSAAGKGDSSLLLSNFKVAHNPVCNPHLCSDT